jgi:hypothetical protein
MIELIRIFRYGAILVPDWFSYTFTYAGNNRALLGFMDAIVLVLETGFAVTAVVALILNLSLPYDVEEATEIANEPDLQPATFTEHDSEAGMSKEVPAIAEKKVDDLDV